MRAGLGSRIFRDKRAIIVALLILAVVDAAFFFGIVYPLQRRVASADKRAAAAKAELAAAEREQKVAHDTLVGKESAQKELRRFYEEILPGDQSAARRITYLRLAELAQESQLEFDRRTFNVEEQRNSSLRRLEITMLLAGNYPNVRRFLHELERSKEFVIINGIELVQRERDESALELTLRLSTYYREAGDGR